MNELRKIFDYMRDNCIDHKIICDINKIESVLSIEIPQLGKVHYPRILKALCDNIIDLKACLFRDCIYISKCNNANLVINILIKYLDCFEMKQKNIYNLKAIITRKRLSPFINIIPFIDYETNEYIFIEVKNINTNQLMEIANKMNLKTYDNLIAINCLKKVNFNNLCITVKEVVNKKYGGKNGE